MKVLVTGAGGYVGSKLIPALMQKGHEPVAFDILYNKDYSFGYAVTGDIRNPEAIRPLLNGCEAVIHLACISNDPASELDPAVTKSVNLDSFRPLVQEAKQAGVRRFINASSSSVYGVKYVPDVTEELSLEPLTDYSKYKAMCEEILLEERTAGFETVSIRPATVCGYSPAMRFDLSVHILTLAAVNKGKITVFGGSQLRPHIQIDDMVDAYLALLEAPADKIDGQVFNAGCENYSMAALAQMVRHMVGFATEIDTQPLNNDPRSYSISSDKIFKVLGWKAKRSILSAIGEVRDCLKDGRVTNPYDDIYYTIKRTKNMGLRP